MAFRRLTITTILLAMTMAGVRASEDNARWSDEELAGRLAYLEGLENRDQRLRLAYLKAHERLVSDAQSGIHSVRIGLPLILPPDMQGLVDEADHFRHRAKSKVSDGTPASNPTRYHFSNSPE